MGQFIRRLTLVDGTYDEDFRQRALKIAFATTDLKHVDQHFGTCESIGIFLVNRDEVHFEETIAFDRAAQDGTEDKLKARVDALAGCAAIYCRAVGASAILQLKKIDVQPLKVPDGTSIKAQLALLQEEMKSEPAFWILRALDSANGMGNDPDRFDDMENEGWDE